MITDTCDAYSSTCPTPSTTTLPSPPAIHNESHSLPFTGFSLAVTILLAVILMAVGFMFSRFGRLGKHRT